MCRTEFGWFKPSFMDCGVRSQAVASGRGPIALQCFVHISDKNISSNTRVVFNNFDREPYDIYIYICIHIYSTCITVFSYQIMLVLNFNLCCPHRGDFAREKSTETIAVEEKSSNSALFLCISLKHGYGSKPCTPSEHQNRW